MSKIKVLHFELDSSIGGIESFLLNLYESIDRDKVQFDFITRANIPAKKDEFEKLGGKIYKVSSYKNPFSYIKDVLEVLENGNYDAVHIHKNSAANILPFIAVKKLQKIIVISHSHNTAPSTGGIAVYLHKINKRFLWQFSDIHLACSNLAGKWLYSPHDNYTVVTNGIITHNYQYNDEVRNSVRNEFNIPKDAIVIGHVGRFTEQKNHKRLVSIFNTIWNINKGCYLLMIGDGELWNSVKKQTEVLGISEYVRMPKTRTDIARLMNTMDIFVMPSIYEGLPVAGVEAQASGMHVFLSNSISKQTDITGKVFWFDLSQSDQEIADMIISQFQYESDRDFNNKLIKNRGYDIETTAKFMLNLYFNNIQVKS